MKLEKAKEILGTFNLINIIGIITQEEFENVKMAIRVVLQALDNSIPKEKVEKRLNNIEEMLDKTTRRELQKYTPSELILIITIYNELLEEDNEKQQSKNRL